MLALLLVAVAHPRRAAAQGGPATSRDTVFFMMACPHDELLHPSEYTCPDSVSAFSGIAIKAATFTVTLANGRKFTQTIKPGTDAIFLSNHALEKFLIPYYASVGDTRKVEAIRAFVGRVNAKAPKAKPAVPPKKP
jgi:hypothetical protein